MMKPATQAMAALALTASMFSPAHAGLLATSSQVANLRIEGTYGFIGLSQPLAQSQGCGSGERVWVDMNNPIGRATYASAMMAYAMKLPVNIRAYEESAKVFGACQLYDIVY